MKTDESKTTVCKPKTCTCTGGKCCCSKGRTRTTMALLKCDIGFGNTLFIRGDKSPLNWDKGIPLSYCKKRQCWVFKADLKEPVEFKVLINDNHWSDGENLILKPKSTTTFEPKFS